MKWLKNQKPNKNKAFASYCMPSGKEFSEGIMFETHLADLARSNVDCFLTK
jgi:hypothetical protein